MNLSTTGKCWIPSRADRNKNKNNVELIDSLLEKAKLYASSVRAGHKHNYVNYGFFESQHTL
jgi:hypothetical protein